MAISLKGASLLPHLRSLLGHGHGHGIPAKSVLKIGKSVLSPADMTDDFGGLCVSGGPDSMALAYLMKDLDARELGVEVKPTAFIVDHNARPGSGEEAKMVSAWLRDLGMVMPSRIEFSLTVSGIHSLIDRLDWPTANPLTLTNFETRARERRYQHLALLARKLNIEHLFLGHHRDDQIETILMRLIRGLNPSSLGLQGMVSTGPIPCCEEFCGIHNQEPPLPTSTLVGLGDHETKVAKGNPVKVLRPGKLKIHRPLLPFSKADLIATCDTNNIPYVQDKTNTDPTFTARNAVRFLRSHHNLPQALQDDSILNLSERARTQAVDIQRRGTKCLRSVKIDRLDLSSGTLSLLVPTSFVPLFQDDPLAAANVVERLSSLVSPGPMDSRSLLAPARLAESFAKAMSSDSSRTFAHSKIMFRAMSPPSNAVNNATTWLFSRAPMTALEQQALELGFDVDVTSTPFSERRTESKPVLWDHRYWMELQASHRTLLSAVKIRSYRKEDAELLRSSMHYQERSRLDKILANHAPGNIRYTLPVLTIEGEIITFPTLWKSRLVRRTFDKCVLALGLENAWLSWEVCYKVITEPITEWAIHQPLTSKVDDTIDAISKQRDRR